MAETTETELEVYLLPLQITGGSSSASSDPTSTISADAIRAALYAALASYDPTQVIKIGSTSSNELYKVSSRGIQLGHADFDSAPFSVSMTGALIASSATISGSITATTGAIGGFVIGSDYIRDAGNTMGFASTVTGGDDVRGWSGAAYVDRATAPFRWTESGVMSLGQSGSNAYMVLDGPNNRIGTSDYASGSKGWRINGDGSAEFMDGLFRGTIRTSVFEKDTVSVVGGELRIASGDTLDADMTALDSATMTMSGNTTFANDSILHLKDDTYEEWVRVLSRVGNVYTVTRDLAGAYSANNNPAWKSGAAAVKEGTSDLSATYSGGWLRALGEGTNSPRYGVFKRTGVAYNATTELAGFGNLNGLIDYASDEYGIAIGSASAYMTYDQTNGLRISGAASVNGSRLGFQDIFGDGSDGTVVISSNTTLARDMFYDVLTIDNGFTLNTGGFRVFCKTSLTNNGTIARDGVAGGNATLTTPGTAGTALADGSIKGSVAGLAGAGVRNTNGSNGTSVAKSLGAVGAAGGIGDNTTGADPAGGTAGTKTGTVFNTPRNVMAAYMLYDFLPSGDNLRSSAGSGSGASGDYIGGGNFGAGGGSASPGGIVAIYSKKITNNGTISANGANGGNGGNGQSTAGNSGGGGGGGGASSGGVILLVYSSYTNNGTVSVAGGTGGSPGVSSFNGVLGGGTATAGGNGSTGTIIQLEV